MDTWTHGHGRIGVWAYGCMDAWARGDMYGRMGAWGHVWADGCVGILYIDVEAVPVARGGLGTASTLERSPRPHAKCKSRCKKEGGRERKSHNVCQGRRIV